MIAAVEMVAPIEVAAMVEAKTTEGRRNGNYKGREARPDDHKEVLKKVREFLDSPLHPDRLKLLVSALITFELKARLQKATVARGIDG